jgi:hypothetical protein
MNPYIQELINDFSGKSYEQFARYVYLTLQREIDSSKGKQKDKYIKVRNDILKYVVSNRGNITLEIRKKKYQ